MNNLPNRMQRPWVFKKMKNHLVLLDCEALGEEGTMRSKVGKVRWGHLREQGQQTGFSGGLPPVHKIVCLQWSAERDSHGSCIRKRAEIDY